MLTYEQNVQNRQKGKADDKGIVELKEGIKKNSSLTKVNKGLIYLKVVIQ